MKTHNILVHQNIHDPDNYGKPVRIGDHAITFRGETCIVEDVRPPHKPSSTGRLRLRMIDNDWVQEYFPGVIDAEWMPQCECRDNGCGCFGACTSPSAMHLQRIDMDDRSGVRFCEECGDEALESGVFGFMEGKDE